MNQVKLRKQTHGYDTKKLSTPMYLTRTIQQTLRNIQHTSITFPPPVTCPVKIPTCPILALSENDSATSITTCHGTPKSSSLRTLETKDTAPSLKPNAFHVSAPEDMKPRVWAMAMLYNVSRLWAASIVGMKGYEAARATSQRAVGEPTV